MRARAALRTAWGRAGLVVLAVLGVVVTVTAASGGLRTVTREQPTAAPGDVIDTGQVELVVTDHVVTDQVDVAALETVPGADAWLVLRVRATAVDDVTVPFFPDVVTVDVPAADGKVEPGVVLLRDGTRSPQLHPDMPEDLLLMWPVRRADVPEAPVVTVRPQERTWSALTTSWSWQEGPTALAFAVPAGPPLPPGTAELLP